jgi:hypothetical protein
MEIPVEVLDFKALQSFDHKPQTPLGIREIPSQIALSATAWQVNSQHNASIRMDHCMCLHISAEHRQNLN